MSFTSAQVKMPRISNVFSKTNTPRLLSCGLLAVSMVFFLVGTALAQAGAAPQPTGWQKLIAMIPMFVMVFFIFFIMVHLPEQKEAKAHADLMEGLNKGDQVVTSSGVIARVAGIEKEYILLEVSNNVKIKVEKEHVKKKREKE